MRNLNLLKQPVYLFPLTAETILMYHVLKNNDIQIAGICDNNVELHGRNYEDCSIVPVVSGEYETVIVCGHRLYIHGKIFKSFLKIDSFLTDSDVAPAYDDINIEKFLSLAPKQKTKLARLKHEIRQVILPRDDAASLNTVNVHVTERCNLKCKYCAALVQYFERPKHIPLESLIGDVDLLMSKVDFVRDIHIIGGEPFVSPHLAGYLRYLTNYRANIGSLYLITNGTLVPKQDVIDALREADVLVRISDYGDASTRKNEVVSELAEHGVVAQITNYAWTYENQLTYDDGDENTDKFCACFAKKFNNCVTDGKFYYCDFLANAEKLKLVPFDESNHLKLDGADYRTICDYLENSDAPKGCKYCGGHDHIREIPAAEQTAAPLKYESFAGTYVET